MTTLYDIVTARRFTEGYLGRKFKDNDEFFHEVFEEWWYKSKPIRPLGEFLFKKYHPDEWKEEKEKMKWQKEVLRNKCKQCGKEFDYGPDSQEICSYGCLSEWIDR